LDLFSGAGGAAVGYHRAGFDVVGVDIEPQPHYPFEFVQANALELLADSKWDGVRAGDWHEFAAIHASPPCQAYSVAAAQQRRAGKEYPDLVAETRHLLDKTSLSYVIENVPGAPIRKDFVLCGCMFELPMLQRERWFEVNWPHNPMRMPCSHRGPALSVTGHGVGAGNGQRGRIAAVLGRNPGITDAKLAMGIEWMHRDELSQAIQPAYTEWIGKQLLAHLENAA